MEAVLLHGPVCTMLLHPILNLSLTLPCSLLPLLFPPITEGLKAEEQYAKDGTLPNPDSTDNAEFKIVLGLIRDSIQKDATKWTR